MVLGDFDGRMTNETVLYAERRHWMVLLNMLVPPTVMIVLGIVFGLGIGGIANYGVFGWSVVTLLCALPGIFYMVWQILDWLNDIFIVTDHRIAHVEQIYFVFKSSRDAQIGKIQDVRFDRSGIVRTMLNYGDVIIETAGTTGQIRFDGVADPQAIKNMIFELIHS